MSEDSINWIDLDDANTFTYQAQDLVPGKYYFRFLYATTLSNLANSNCTTVSDPIGFEVLPAFYTAKDTICEGLGYAYGDSVYFEPGFYQHTFTRAHACDSVVTLELIHVADPGIMTDYNITSTSCEGASDGAISIQSVTGIDAPYTFTLNNVAVPAHFALTLPAGVYTAVVTDEFGCYEMQELQVPEGLPLQVKTIGDTSLLYGKRLELTTSTNFPISEASWSPRAHLDCATCLSPEVIIKDSITYVVWATTESGCEASDTVTVWVTHMPVRYVPNIFSPNNDQVNDVFEITLEPVSFTSVDRIMVFDRWGSVVHQQSNLMPAESFAVWDGNTAGGPASSGVYFYSIDYTLIDGERGNIRGDVTIIK